MSSRRTLFRVLYQLGFTPWDGHPISESLQGLVEGDHALTPGRALDVGCGTGDSSIYLAQHGWQVTGLDFVPKALAKARAKADSANASVDFKLGDATKLSGEGVGRGVQPVSRQRLHAWDGRRRSRQLCPRSHRRRFAWRASRRGRVHARRIVVGARNRPTRDRRALLQLDAAVDRRRAAPQWCASLLRSAAP